MPEALPLPTPMAVVFADQIIVEAMTGKKTLVGLYSTIFARRLPLRRQVNIFVELGDAQGSYDFLLELVRLETGAVVARGQLEGVRSRDRLTPLELVVRVPVSFPAYGTYEARISFESQVFASRTVRVLAPPEPSGGASFGPPEAQ